MSQVKKSLLKVEKLQFDIYINKQLIQVDYDDQTTVGEVLDLIIRKQNISNSDVSLYLAKKSGEPKLSFPALERNRKLIRTNEKRFVVVVKQVEPEIKNEFHEKDIKIIEGRQKKQSIFKQLFGISMTCK
ncbi:unnamed protein product (macronuclear) [Paramecium tetraurelia]|uniref:Chromosome undetermined scaffold_1, whole genome shotgun sequence n=1 Tax=Paramecium tetraurelia TaxID=5888 RepID=Q6BFP0_PARTE|nr:hypothetical protein [Paramecium tetraurelia strain d4-2]XP_001423127.1 uncharacterized protein GSPATT00000164001 [Paramecium tetraurelia]CAH03530.1 hypothetical protein PTMB.332c [Paramecium tetraurelia]CAK55729.1 unnamed protein product [Paramecium tetraurelia]|eukprot:XP_001423127.1 hypothetical protein (macronuclear) [Paramecium tetraurelia strain d4-2]